MITAGPRCDIFCRVVDNFGDIGVTWRLARQLSDEHRCQVRIIVDNLYSFQKLVPQVVVAHGEVNEQLVGGVTVVEWREPFAALSPADLVIEAFGCELPETYIHAMTTMAHAPVWINLEYLSAEPWVAEHQLLPSPQSHYALTKYFFFPGFATGTGGLIREKSAAVGSKATRSTADNSPLKIFMFAYSDAPFSPLFAAMAETHKPICCGMSDAGFSTELKDKLKQWRGSQAENALESALVLEFMPFVPQSEFDQILADHDILFVRGEDSLVRAIWAARPFVWQIYPQSENAHMVKLSAFLDLYCVGLAAAASAAMRELWRAWNTGDAATMPNAWRHYEQSLPELREHAARWSSQQSAMPDLARNLLSFYQKTAKI
ncbi:MAG: elongation factor P maturation arginine rhamnosyltransferase EarP [Betaproteobacteria bacterium]